MKRLAHKLGVAQMTFGMGFRQIIQSPIAVLGQILLLATIVSVYVFAFRGIPPEELQRLGLSASRLTLYFVMTEFITFCVRLPQKELQIEILEGQLSSMLLRPCPLWVIKVGEWSGQFTAHYLLLAVPALLLGTLYAPDETPSMGNFALALLSLFPAGLLYTLGAFMVGASTAWLKHTEPVLWIWQKLLFLFGALLWPLLIFPPLFQTIAWLTPFPAMLAVPGGWMLGSFNEAPLLPIVFQLLWILLFIAATDKVGKNLLRHMQKTGEG